MIRYVFKDTATTEIYTLSLHDALPILCDGVRVERWGDGVPREAERDREHDEAEEAREQRQHTEAQHRQQRHETQQDRKSTRLNSSHANISYAVFCLKKKRVRPQS